MLTIGPRKQTRLRRHPDNGTFVEHTKAMQLIVHASPETVAVCRAERANLATIGDVCTNPLPLATVNETKYQDIMGKLLNNHDFEEEHEY